jgi:hypothetical protein
MSGGGDGEKYLLPSLCTLYITARVRSNGVIHESACLFSHAPDPVYCEFSGDDAVAIESN